MNRPKATPSTDRRWKARAWQSLQHWLAPQASLGDPESATVLAAYAAFARADIDAAVADLDADVEWIEPDEFPDGGRHVGREAVRGYLQRSRARWRGLRSTPTLHRRGRAWWSSIPSAGC